MFARSFFTLRCLAIFGFLALLTGCITNPCRLPGELSEDPGRDCYYQLTVTHIDMDRYIVKGKLPEVLVEKATGEKLDTPEMTKQEFIFRVRDLDKLGKQMEVKKTYEFIRQGNSPYLELLPEEPR